MLFAKSMINGRSLLRANATYRSMLAFFALLLASAPLAAQEQWGKGSFEEEGKAYSALVRQLEIEANQIRSRIQQVENDLEAYLGNYSASRRQALAQEYERHTDNVNRRELHFRAQEKEQQSKNLYDDARVAFTPEQEKVPDIRRNLWTKHVDWLRCRIRTLYAELGWQDSKLVVMKGLAGIDWEEFWADNAEDLVYVYKSVLLALRRKWWWTK